MAGKPLQHGGTLQGMSLPWRNRCNAGHAASAGCTAPEIMAVSGHATLSEAQKYIVAVEQERMAEAAMAKRAAGTRQAQTVSNVFDSGV